LRTIKTAAACTRSGGTYVVKGRPLDCGGRKRGSRRRIQPKKGSRERGGQWEGSIQGTKAGPHMWERLRQLSHGEVAAVQGGNGQNKGAEGTND